MKKFCLMCINTGFKPDGTPCDHQQECPCPNCIEERKNNNKENA
jgi:hypothetical protein